MARMSLDAAPPSAEARERELAKQIELNGVQLGPLDNHYIVKLDGQEYRVRLPVGTHASSAQEVDIVGVNTAPPQNLRSFQPVTHEERLKLTAKHGQAIAHAAQRFHTKYLNMFRDLAHTRLRNAKASGTLEHQAGQSAQECDVQGTSMIGESYVWDVPDTWEQLPPEETAEVWVDDIGRDGEVDRVWLDTGGNWGPLIPNGFTLSVESYLDIEQQPRQFCHEFHSRASEDVRRFLPQFAKFLK